jgi:predicted transposase YbfD/YdcC
MKLLELIAEIKDPRDSWKIKHELSALFFTTVCGVLCGAETWNEISEFCEAKKDWLAQYVNFSGGIPSPWTFRRLFTLLKADVVEVLLRTYALSLAGKADRSSQQIAIDGKALRGSKRHHLQCLHSVSAMCRESGLILAEVVTDQKSNETTAVPLLLDLLDLKGRTVTIDAAGCQNKIVTQIKESEGEYVLSLKKNHPKFYEMVEKHMQTHAIKTENCLKDYFDESHGRCVRRRCFAVDVSQLEEHEALKTKWTGIQSIIALENIRSLNNDVTCHVSAEWHYYISSHTSSNTQLADYIRGHWCIENNTHWVLDVHLKEDSDQKAEKNSARAFAILRRIALNIIKTKDQNSKRSLKRRLKRAAWDNDYLLSLLL